MWIEDYPMTEDGNFPEGKRAATQALRHLADTHVRDARRMHDQAKMAIKDAIAMIHGANDHIKGANEFLNAMGLLGDEAELLEPIPLDSLLFIKAEEISDEDRFREHPEERLEETKDSGMEIQGRKSKPAIRRSASLLDRPDPARRPSGGVFTGSYASQSI